MKIDEITAFGEFPGELNPAVNQYLQKNKKELTRIEGGEYVISIVDDAPNTYYTLEKNDNIIGLVEFRDISYYDVLYNEIVMIYIVPEFRKTKALSVLIFGLTAFIKKSILLDGAIFKDGQALIAAVNRRPELFKLQTLNKESGEITPFTTLTTDRDLAIIVKVGAQRMYECYTPGSLERFYFTWFD